MTGYVYKSGDEYALVAYGEQDGEKMTMVIYFSPELGKEITETGDFDTSDYSSLLF